MFKNRKLVIATKHKKETVISPILEESLGVNCFIPNDFDTDDLGTFSGEIERKDNALNTVRQKCLIAMKLTNCNLGIASEGSFGMHPDIFFAHADDEIMMFIDQKNDLEIIAREVSLDTNFNSIITDKYPEIVEFANKAIFPSHALILKDRENKPTIVHKGIQSWKDLKDSFDEIITKTPQVIVETDMRAQYNPSRMKVIEKTTKKLLEKINSLCPECQTPGFSIVSAKSGLPCAWCKRETNGILSHVYQCKKCHYKLEKMYPNGKETSDPMYCDYCNP